MKRIGFLLIIMTLVLTTMNCERPEEVVIEDPLPDFDYEVLYTEASFINKSKHYEELLWEFGDGSKSTEENPIHIYEDLGSYKVTLSVGRDGKFESINKVVVVQAKKVNPSLSIKGFPHWVLTELEVNDIPGIGETLSSQLLISQGDLFIDKPRIMVVEEQTDTFMIDGEIDLTQLPSASSYSFNLFSLRPETNYYAKVVHILRRSPDQPIDTFQSELISFNSGIMGNAFLINMTDENEAYNTVRYGFSFNLEREQDVKGQLEFSLNPEFTQPIEPPTLERVSKGIISFRKQPFQPIYIRYTCHLTAHTDITTYDTLVVSNPYKCFTTPGASFNTNNIVYQKRGEGYFIEITDNKNQGSKLLLNLVNLNTEQTGYDIETTIKNPGFNYMIYYHSSGKEILWDRNIPCTFHAWSYSADQTNFYPVSEKPGNEADQNVYFLNPVNSQHFTFPNLAFAVVH